MGLQSKPTPITILSETNKTYDIIWISVHSISFSLNLRNNDVTAKKREYADPHHGEVGPGRRHFVHKVK